jgi:hypothetical protein
MKNAAAKIMPTSSIENDCKPVLRTGLLKTTGSVIITKTPIGQTTAAMTRVRLAQFHSISVTSFSTNI